MGATSDRHELANGSQNAAFGGAAIFASPAETNQVRLLSRRENDQVGSRGQDELAGTVPGLHQFVGHLIDSESPPPESNNLFDLCRMMSVAPPSTVCSPNESITPLGYVESSFFPRHHVLDDAGEEEQHNHDRIDDGPDDHLQVEPDAFQPVGCPAHFLSRSIIACLRKNEGMDHDAEIAMKEASKSFERMLITRHEGCLTSLNLLLALLEAHGKRHIAIELLGKFNIAALSLKSSPERESVVLTIRFKMDVMYRLKTERMSDPAALRQVHYHFERWWGPDSPSTLACLCNLGWRLAGDNDAGRLTEGLDVLSRARVSLERVLGEYDPQTITCLTMLARVLCNLERHLEGLEMMRTAMDRIVTRFPDYHPYRLAALRRLSLFMQKVRSGNVEPILREVASKRLRIFGHDCELTQGSLKELRKFLVEHGRHDEADDAFRAIAEAASRIHCDGTVFHLF